MHQYEQHDRGRANCDQRQEAPEKSTANRASSRRPASRPPSPMTRLPERAPEGRLRPDQTEGPSRPRRAARAAGSAVRCPGREHGVFEERERVASDEGPAPAQGSPGSSRSGERGEASAGRRSARAHRRVRRVAGARRPEPTRAERAARRGQERDHHRGGGRRMSASRRNADAGGLRPTRSARRGRREFGGMLFGDGSPGRRRRVRGAQGPETEGERDGVRGRARTASERGRHALSRRLPRMVVESRTVGPVAAASGFVRPCDYRRTTDAVAPTRTVRFQPHERFPLRQDRIGPGRGVAAVRPSPLRAWR
jgi:hypothetical protein